MLFAIDKSKDGQYYFRLRADNSEILCHSETYHNKSDVEHAIKLIQDGAAKATIVDISDK